MAFVSLLPKALKHDFAEADIIVVAHIPAMDEDHTLLALVPWLLKFVSIRIGHVIHRTGKRRV